MSTLADNIDRARGFLQRFAAGPVGHCIGGEMTPGGGTAFDNHTPADNSVLCQVMAATPADVDAACGAAAAAAPAWAAMPGAARRRLLHHFAERIVARAEEIALVESMDCGQPIRFMKQAAQRGAENFRFFADKAAEARDGRALLQDDHTNITLRSPIGPVAVITPWNTPFMLATWKIAPALAAGCTVVHKPAEFSPLSAMLLAEIAREAGIPPGVWNTVNGFGESAGRALTEHPEIRAVAFVGETVTGSRIMAQGAPTLKRVHFELGGKNPVIVFDDADFERALDAVVFMIYSLNGQRCTSSSRLLLQRGIRERFLAALAARVAAIRIGHPLDPATELGPLIHPSHLDKVAAYIDIARDEGAQLTVGGRRRPDLGKGNYFDATLITGANAGMRVAREEIFGPVLTVLDFDTEEEALALANDSPYGLAAYLWTRDLGRAMRVSRRIEAGMLWVNSENNRNLPSPFGGVKQSGIGRDGGDWSFDFYMETRNVCFGHDTHGVPVLGR